jgi:hypothetical protein
MAASSRRQFLFFFATAIARWAANFHTSAGTTVSTWTFDSC